MKNDELDAILSKDQEIIPSSGFVNVVMDAVRREAATPPPIPFPWKYALPGIVAAGLVVAAIVIAAFTQVVQVTTTSEPQATLQSLLAPTLEKATVRSLGWVCVALLMTFFSLMLTRRFTRLRG